MQPLLHCVQNIAILRPLGLDRRKEVPDLAGALLDGQRTEAHLKAAQNRPQCRRTGDNHTALPLDDLGQTRSADDFGKEAFYGQEQDAEVRGLGRVQILPADVPAQALTRFSSCFPAASAPSTSALS